MLIIKIGIVFVSLPLNDKNKFNSVSKTVPAYNSNMCKLIPWSSKQLEIHKLKQAQATY
jgi:hypothetical protein